MKPEVTKALLEYEQLKLNAKTIENRLEELKPIIMAEVEVGKKYEGEEGSFEVKSKPVWKFSPRVVQMKEEVKKFEAEEIAKGIAVNNPTIYLEYRVRKVD